MTNWEYLKNLPIEEFAKLTIQYCAEEDYDYNYDEELEYKGLTDYYLCSDGERFEYEQDAIEHEIWWLKQERIENNG